MKDYSILVIKVKRILVSGHFHQLLKKKMNASRKTFALAQMCVRHFGQSATRAAQTEVPSSQFNKLKSLQKYYGVEDGRPIYIKGGTTDKVLFGITLVLTAIGLGMSGQVLYKLS